jgi:hypothetical protein
VPGARLARLELAAFLSELLDRIEKIELRGEPRYNASNFTWGLRQLPVCLRAENRTWPEGCGYYGNFEAEPNNLCTNSSYYRSFTGMMVLPDRPLPSSI